MEKKQIIQLKPAGLVAQIAFEQNCLSFCSLQGENRSKSYSFARLFNAEEGKKASKFAVMYLGNTPIYQSSLYIHLSTLQVQVNK